ncbi:SDR family oxidoreductase [Arthrobacter sp. H5]|uniref:SDR family NAD(P)-dependent oxidoreductase n=1 Tax=Arthrobacter sp. H5 TaxID=1267973 RepID=UPI0004B1730C|nr:SDR family oxidoreductase [Arthrobacter sp. H5]
MNDLTNQVVLITGAGGLGIGRGMVESVLEAGATVVGVDLSAEAAGRLSEAYPQVRALVGDVADEAQVQRIFHEAGPVDALINSAGIGLVKPFHEVEASEYDRVHDVDVRGTWLTCRAFARQVLSQGRTGSIVNVSSVHGTATTEGFAVYAAAKAAVEGLTRGMAIDLGSSGIRCNGVAPGYVPAELGFGLPKDFSDESKVLVDEHVNDFQVLNRLMDGRHIGDAAVFLLSDAARGITGQTLLVDAGLTLRLYNSSYSRRMN